MIILGIIQLSSDLKNFKICVDKIIGVVKEEVEELEERIKKAIR